MNKIKKILLSLALVSGLMLTGCGSDNDSTPIDIHYLTDFNGGGISGIPYDCGYYIGITDRYGAYEFDPYDYRCEFDLLGVYEDLYIFDEIGPINGLRYQCIPSEIFGVTGDFIDEGGFDYDTDDYCLIGRY